MARALLIHGGSVINGTGRPPVRASVLVEGELITAFGGEADQRAATLAGCVQIDASGLTVLPGLIDAHCHISFDEVNSNDELFFHRRHGLAALVAANNAGKLLRAGVTSFLDADSLFEIGIDLRDAIEAGVVDGPRMACGGYAILNSVGGTAGRLIPDEGIIGYGKVVRTKDEIAIEVRRQIKAGVDWIKVHVTGLIPRQKVQGEIQVFNADELNLICTVAHDLGTPVTGHCRGAKSVLAAARAGFDMILHATFMDEAAFEAVAERKIPLVPTFTFQANLADFGARIGADPGAMALFRREVLDSREMLQRAHRAGVPLLCGTESGFSLTPYGEWHYREMEVFVRDIGLAPLEAIRCGTLEGARALRMEGKIGEIAPGRLADILVVDGDPVADIGVLGDPKRRRYVLKGGRAIDLDPPPIDRKPIGGWRVGQYGRILSRRDAGLDA
jgi:imidazolonepropionase-like amidohydrolase